MENSRNIVLTELHWLIKLSCLSILIGGLFIPLACKKNDTGPEAQSPSCSISIPENNSIFQAGTSIAIEAEVLGFGHAVSVFFTIDTMHSETMSVAPFELMWDIPGMLEDTFCLKVVAQEGNLTASDSIRIIIIDTISVKIPPFPLFTVYPETGSIDTIFVFDASASHDTSTAFEDLLFRFDFEGDEVWDTDFTHTYHYEFKYNHAGNYQPLLEVMDTDGLVADTSIVLPVQHSATPDPCDGYISVLYGNIVYHTVRVGEQCWLRENMDIGEMILAGEDQNDNQVIEKYCYNNDPENCVLYGGLYKWKEALNHMIPLQGARGICPPGYHIPSNDEWKVLEGTVDSQYGPSSSIWEQHGFRGHDAGRRMKAMMGWIDGGNGSNISGFKALAAGYWSAETAYHHMGEGTSFWSTAHGGIGEATTRSLMYDHDGISLDFKSIEDAFSVRCIKD